MRPRINPPPPTAAEPVTETLHGVAVTDAYRWLEDSHSPKTRSWLEAQSAYTLEYFVSCQIREAIRGRVAELLSLVSSIDQPWNVGDRYFLRRRPKLCEQPVIVMRDGLFGRETVLVDPASRGSGNSTAVSIEAISEDGRYLAYSVRRGGTDHFAVEILDVESNNVLPDRLPEGFCTGFAFAADGSGFCYSHREVGSSRPNYSAAFWHKFGTSRFEDKEIFFAGEVPGLFLRILLSKKANCLFFVLVSTGKKHRTSVYLQSLSDGSGRALVEDVTGFFFPFLARGLLFALTDFGAPNYRIVKIDLTNPDPTSWRDVVPECARRIQRFAGAGDQIFVTRVDRFSTQLEAFSLEGQQKDEIPSPPGGTIELLNQTTTTNKLIYSDTSICRPATIYCFDAQESKTTTWEEPQLPFDSSKVVTSEVTYPSKDGTLIPLFLAVRRDLLNSGPLPTFITGYGGFGTCVTPRFTAFATFLIERGVLFAVPALRGGAELGTEWHLAGKLEKRQNSFDDMIAAAEWLLSQGRSTPGRIAVGGGSNAGLLVGAVITQRPDLFRAAICLGPLLDMTRYHLFDFASRWADEYGSPDEERDFQSLLSYSPYHQVREGVDYPAVLFISGDADNRCNPMHARKMVARMQVASRSGHPILLEYRSAWGHTPVQPLSSKIEALTNRLAFLCRELGIDLTPREVS